MILRYVAYWPINLGLVLLAYILSPLLALWSMRYGPALPGRWRWFSTLNADLDGGWAQKVIGFKDPATLGFWALWCQRTRWTWRNPCNGWQSEALGITNMKDGFRIKRDIPLAFGFYLKWWVGWNPNKRGGSRYPYMFQSGLKRR